MITCLAALHIVFNGFGLSHLFPNIQTFIRSKHIFQINEQK